MKNIFKNTLFKLKSHKIASSIIIITIVIGFYGIYSSAKISNILPQYTLSPVHLGTITQTITGSGQISASNQTDILSQSSGTIKTINVSVGERVSRGQLIATIDLANAAIALENARISYAKAIQPAKDTDITNSQNALLRSYNDGFNSAVTIYLDLPDIMSGMRDLLYGQTSFLSDQSSSYLSSVSREYRDTAGRSYDKALTQYNVSLKEYNGLTRNSATSSINAMLRNTYKTIDMVTEAVSAAQTAVNYIRTYEQEYKANSATTASSNVSTWANKSNSDLGNLLSAQNNIESNTNSLNTLVAGTDDLDRRQAQLSLEQAQRTYDNYFVRAPYDGIIGRIPVNVFGQASSGTVIATIIGQQKIANISLNEVDAAKVKVGQLVQINFDAIDNLNATGTVKVVDQIGTVSSGVVAYNIKIAVDTEDPRIKPGMSVNTTIITKRLNDVLVVPSSAIKTLGTMKYVQTLDPSLLNQNSTSTRRINTVSTAILPSSVRVTIGESDDTNTEITEGLKIGQSIITKTVTGSAIKSTTAPSILSSFGTRTPGQAGMRPTTPNTSVRPSGIRPGN